jgi:hypothetical protein
MSFQTIYSINYGIIYMSAQPDIKTYAFNRANETFAFKLRHPIASNPVRSHFIETN